MGKSLKKDLKRLQSVAGEAATESKKEAEKYTVGAHIDRRIEETQNILAILMKAKAEAVARGWDTVPHHVLQGIVSPPYPF